MLGSFQRLLVTDTFKSRLPYLFFEWNSYHPAVDLIPICASRTSSCDSTTGHSNSLCPDPSLNFYVMYLTIFDIFILFIFLCTYPLHCIESSLKQNMLSNSSETGLAPQIF